MTKMYLSVVIPAYNEETNIRLGALDKVARFLEHQSYTWEVIVVNDGSSDSTRSLVESFVHANKDFSLINNHHQGKAASVITGMLAAHGDVALFTDLDQATPIQEVDHVLPWFDRGFDIVIGSRNTKREGAPLLRIIMARGFMLLRSLLLGLDSISDTQCGFKAFRRNVAKDIFRRLKLYGNIREVSGSMVTAGFDIEVLYLAKILGFKTKEVTVEWHYVETRRVNPIKDSWQGFLDIVRIRLLAWKGFYS